jgi:hypothetical protein
MNKGKRILILRCILVNKVWGCLKSQNPLTAEDAKARRKVRKELILCALALRSLQHLSVLCG